jgi:hypothetical protein
MTIKNEGIFYNINKYEKNKSGDTIRISEYPYDNFWKVLSSSESWKQPNFHELITQRNKIATEEIQYILSTIKKNNLPVKKVSKPKLALKSCLDLIFKLIPRKVLEKLFKIYY